MATPGTFIDAFDGFIVDADGVLYRGSAPVQYAIDAMTEVAQSRPWCVVTNNAANAPGVVAEKLRGLGLAADDDNIVTSPQGAAVFLAQHHIGRIGPRFRRRWSGDRPRFAGGRVCPRS